MGSRRVFGVEEGIGVDKGLQILGNVTQRKQDTQLII